jgi:hypothetical protein
LVAAAAGLIALPTQGGSVPLVVSRYPPTWACDKSRFKGLGSYHCLLPEQRNTSNLLLESAHSRSSVQSPSPQSETRKFQIFVLAAQKSISPDRRFPIWMPIKPIKAHVIGG